MNKGVDGDSSSFAEIQRAGEGASPVRSKDVEYHSRAEG